MRESGLLIVNADDVGRDAHASNMTIECFEAGRITSASAMVYMEDSDRAAELLRAAGVPVGLHINLSEAFTDRGTPPGVRSRQAGLVRRFGPDAGRQARRWLYDPLISREVERSIADQLERFEILFGEAPDHVDGHQHVHLSPNVFLARSLPRGTRTRSTLETYPLRRSPLGVARSLRARLSRLRFPATDYFFDISEVDTRRDPEDARERLALSEAASVEVMCHPGFPEECECLTSSEWQEALHDRPLGSFADLQRVGAPSR